MNLFSDKILQAICWTLLHSLWQALLLAIITGLIMVISKKSSSTIRYNLLSCVFILFAIIISLTFYRQWQLTAGNKMELVAAHNASSNQPGTIVSSEKNIQSNDMLQNYLSVFINYFNTYASLIVTIWFIIFMAKCVRILSGLVNIQRIRHYKINDAPEYWKERISALATRLGIQKQILLLESAIIKVPVVVGILKPAVLIPIGLLTNISPQEVESILIHELAHIRRRDYFFNLLQCFIDIIFFFNPAILWISSLIRAERENCCDDIAIHQTQNKKQFVQALVSFHQYNISVSKYAMPFAKDKNRLVNRVQRIVNNKNHTLNPAEKIVLVVSMFVFSAFFISISKGQNISQKKQETHNKAVTAKKNNDLPQKVSKQSHILLVASKKNNGTANKKRNSIVTPTPDVSVNVEPLPCQDAWQSLGFKNISLEKEQELKNHGVSPEFIQKFYQAGYKDISLEKAEGLKNHGVNLEFINSLKAMGFKNISLDKARELKDHGVSSDFITGFYQLGYKDISLEKAQELSDHGVSPDFITGFYQLGYKDISLDRALELKDHGVSPDFIAGFYQLGYKDISLEKAGELKDHDVNSGFINDFRQAGFKNIPLEKMMVLRDHGVSIGFIEAMKKKTGSELTIDEYIILKDRL